jgi:hypothetical protein
LFKVKNVITTITAANVALNSYKYKKTLPVNQLSGGDVRKKNKRFFKIQSSKFKIGWRRLL